MGGYCPVSLRLQGRRGVVVGGGDEAASVAAALADGGADVLVISPQLGGRLEPLARAGRVEWVARAYEGPSDLAGAMVVAAVAGESQLDQRVAADARRSRALLLTTGTAQGDLLLPEVLRRGRLTIAVDTGGRGLPLARRIREELETAYGSEYGVLLELLGQLGDQLPDPGQRQLFADTLARPEVAVLIREGRLDEVEQEVGRLLGPSAT
ncbi:MAG: NAD(P)-dependent oxidoreductase [bacterium]|nr:NAD(P)-dependent oxidoreductase [bacterium]